MFMGRLSLELVVGAEYCCMDAELGGREANGPELDWVVEGGMEVGMVKDDVPLPAERAVFGKR